MSFLDFLRQLQANHPNMNFFLPSNNSEPYLDHLLQPVGLAPHQGLGNRRADLVSNASRVCTSVRWIVELAFARCFDHKLSGVKFPIAHQLLEASGTNPTPNLPGIAIWLDVMAVIRRLTQPYTLKYGLAPGVTYADHGRDLLSRLTKENVLCTTKGLVFNRRDIFANVTNPELRNGTVRLVNLLDQRQTECPILTVEQLMGITLGPFSVDRAHGYMTSIHERDVLAHLQGNYQDPDHFHNLASQVS